MEIKRFDSSHLEPIQQLYLNSRLATFTWVDSSTFALEDFCKDCEGEQIWIATQAGELIGFISIWQPERFIHHLYVSPNHLGCGVGSELLKHIQQQHNNLSLKCFVANQNAVRFYANKGFKITQKVEDGPQSYYLMTYQRESG